MSLLTYLLSPVKAAFHIEQDKTGCICTHIEEAHGFVLEHYLYEICSFIPKINARVSVLWDCYLDAETIFRSHSQVYSYPLR